MNAAQQYQYVFDDLKHNMLAYIPIPAAIIILMLILTFNRSEYNQKKQDNTQGRIQSGINGIVLLVIIFAVLYGVLAYQLRISGHCSVTTGRLIHKSHNNYKGNSWQYTYEYKAGSKTYQEDEVYTQRLTGDVSAGKCYTVLYDSTDPGNAIMLLHEERACTVGN